jgi:hypothetical protein
VRDELRALAWWVLTGTPVPEALREDLQTVGACLLMAVAPALFVVLLGGVGR